VPEGYAVGIAAGAISLLQAGGAESASGEAWSVHYEQRCTDRRTHRSTGAIRPAGRFSGREHWKI